MISQIVNVLRETNKCFQFLIVQGFEIEDYAIFKTNLKTNS